MASKEEFEDKVLNPLNNIVLLVDGSEDIKKEIIAEVDKVVLLLEKEGLIRKRIHKSKG